MITMAALPPTPISCMPSPTASPFWKANLAQSPPLRPSVSQKDYHNWPALWTEDSAAEANGVYKGVTFHSAVFKANDVPKEITITLPKNYDPQQTPRVTRQLAKAAYHLAELLNQIKWQQ